MELLVRMRKRSEAKRTRNNSDYLNLMRSEWRCDVTSGVEFELVTDKLAVMESDHATLLV